MLLAAVGCGGAPSGMRLATSRAPCAEAEHWDGRACQQRSDGAGALERAVQALAEFQVEQALAELERARAAEPHRFETLVTIYEQLGIAQAYLGHEAEAMAAFDKLLALDPGHLLSYTLSPRATFVFERARSRSQRATAIDLSWPRDLEVDESIPVDVEVLADPATMLHRATLEVRTKGADDHRSFDLELAAPGRVRRVVLPALEARRPEVLQLWLRAFDQRGNEVLRWSSADAPREIPLGYRPPTPWYRTWWVWAVAGTAVAVGTGATVYLMQHEPSSNVGGGLDIDR